MHFPRSMSFRCIVLALPFAFAAFACTGTHDGNAAVANPRVVITSSQPIAIEKPPASGLRVTIAGEPWQNAQSVSATSMSSPATGDWRPWGTSPGARIVTLTAARTDGRSFVVQIALPNTNVKKGDSVNALAEYRTTTGAVWRSSDTARARIVRLERDARGQEALVSVAFDVELRSKDAERPLVVAGEIADVAVTAEEL
jgi:hypothetical protein